MDEPNISVCIMESEKLEFILDGYFNLKGSDRIYNGKFTAEIQKNSIIIKQNDFKLNFDQDLIFFPREYDTDHFIIKNIPVSKGFHREKKEQHRYKGSVKIIILDGKIITINIIPLEDYLKCVLSNEVKQTESQDYLKSYAIVARSWILAQLAKKNKKQTIKSAQKTESELIHWAENCDHLYYDVCSGEHCQIYPGITKVENSNVEEAVKLTYGMVLAYQDEICDTRYSKCCGGITESHEYVWDEKKIDYLTSIVDYKYRSDFYPLDLKEEQNAKKWIMSNPSAFCNNSPEKNVVVLQDDPDREKYNYFRWKIIYTADELQKILEEKTNCKFGKILEIESLSRGFSGRLEKIRITGENNTLIIGKELEIRRVLSRTHLFSSAIIIEKEKDDSGNIVNFVIYGAGWGHGVGLCLSGASNMGLMGYYFDEILIHYFKGASIKKVYT